MKAARRAPEPAYAAFNGGNHGRQGVCQADLTSSVDPLRAGRPERSGIQICRVNLGQQAIKPPLARHFLTAISLACSNVGPFPIPDAFVMGHQDFTVISLAKALLVPSRAMKVIPKKCFMFSPLCNSIAFNLYASVFRDKPVFGNSNDASWILSRSCSIDLCCNAGECRGASAKRRSESLDSHSRRSRRVLYFRVWRPQGFLRIRSRVQD